MYPMMKRLIIAIALAGCAKTPTPANYRVPEGVTPDVFRAFVATNPCPGRVAGYRALVCSDFVPMHNVPLCAGGEDSAANLRWVPLADREKKQRADRARCGQAAPKT